MSDEKKEEVQQEVQEEVAEETTEAGKQSRGEKKFKKALQKMGMKTLQGINRVTIRKAKNFLLFIDSPEVMVMPGNENSYVVFGEAKMQDFNQNLANTEASKFKKAEQPKEAPKAEDAKDDEEDLNEEGVDAETITMVMDHCKCSRAKAVKALKNNNNDSVNAILEIEGN